MFKYAIVRKPSRSMIEGITLFGQMMKNMQLLEVLYVTRSTEKKVFQKMYPTLRKDVKNQHQAQR